MQSGSLDYFRNFTPAMVPFRQTSWQGLALDANAMLNWQGSSIAPLMTIRAPLSEMSTTLQSRLAKPPSTTCAGKSRFMRRSPRFWRLKNIALGAFEYDLESKPDPHDSFRGSHRAHRANERYSTKLPSIRSGVDGWFRTRKTRRVELAGSRSAPVGRDIFRCSRCRSH